LYHCAMALGSIKEKMLQIETYGSNLETIKENKNGIN
jgi:hypothetical protein